MARAHLLGYGYSFDGRLGIHISQGLTVRLVIEKASIWVVDYAGLYFYAIRSQSAKVCHLRVKSR